MTTTSITWVPIGLSVAVTTTSATSFVFLTSNLNIAGTYGYVSLFRGETNLGGTSGQQTMRGQASQTYRNMANTVFTDSPGTVGSVTYSIRIYHSHASDLTVSDLSSTRQLAAVVIPLSQANYQVSSATMLFSSTSWSSGLMGDRTITTLGANCKVLLAITMPVITDS